MKGAAKLIIAPPATYVSPDISTVDVKGIKGLKKRCFMVFLSLRIICRLVE